MEALIEEISEDDIRRLGAKMKELTETRGWSEYKQILQTHIATREALVFAPLHDLPTKSDDAQAKLLMLESIKGALIGLKLARDLPDTIIQHAADIHREEVEENA